MGPGALNDVIEHLPRQSDPALLVGFDTADDACVFQINQELALIQTADFFPPMVDDPYLFGQIAAANAFSDVYAMGGEPRLALNLLCINSCLDKDVIQAMLQGGAERAQLAECTISGGHTIEDPVPKYGLSVTGFVHPQNVWRNVGAKSGDALVLTKPLGSGVLLTALKAEFIEPDDCETLFETMKSLNQTAKRTAEGLDVHACTDITGFGLLGHLYEMALGSHVTIHVQAGALPLFPLAEEMAQQGMLPVGAYRNFDYIQPFLSIHRNVSSALRDIVSDPQTSGGLCISLPQDQADDFVQRMEWLGESAWKIGFVTDKNVTDIELEP